MKPNTIVVCDIVQYLMMSHNAKRERINLISSITNQGKVRFMIYTEAMNAQKFIKFCKRLIKDAGRKIYLILDNLRVHNSHVVKDWIQGHKKQIILFFLPSYSPELNPDEYLNCDLEAGVHSGALARNKSQLKSKAISQRMLQKKPKRVAKYFKHPKDLLSSMIRLLNCRVNNMNLFVAFSRRIGQM